MNARRFDKSRLPSRQTTEGPARAQHCLLPKSFPHHPARTASPLLRTMKRIRLSCLAAAVLGTAILGPGVAFALDAAPRPQPLMPVTKYSSVREALRTGMRDYNA